MNNIKKGNLNYDQTGRAYPDNSEIKENWDCIWENEGKYYKIIGLPNHAEWEEVWVKNKEKYNQIIDEAYERYWSSIETSEYDGIGPTSIKLPTLMKEEFINKCKKDPEFSEKWGLKIEERELSAQERVAIFMENKRTNKFEDNNCDIPTKLITITYNNETIESYE